LSTKCVQLAILHLIWLLENRVRASLPLEPMRRLGDSHHIPDAQGIGLEWDEKAIVA
jgi:hypothetical protein